MYAHTSVVHAKQMQRHESSSLLETVILSSYNVHSPSDHEHIVSFQYEEEVSYNDIPQVKVTHTHFNGRIWS